MGMGFLPSVEMMAGVEMTVGVELTLWTFSLFKTKGFYLAADTYEPRSEIFLALAAMSTMVGSYRVLRNKPLFSKGSRFVVRFFT
jgi:hypothetical protein